MALSIKHSPKPHTHSSRCGYCHDDVPADDLLACSRCGIELHAPCWHEAGRCPTLGCVPRRRRADAYDAPYPQATRSPLLVDDPRRRRRPPIMRPLAETLPLAFFGGVFGGFVGVFAGLMRFAGRRAFTHDEVEMASRCVKDMAQSSMLYALAGVGLVLLVQVIRSRVLGVRD